MPILDLDGRRLDPGWRLEVRPDQLSVPRPVVLGVAGRVDADVAAPGPDEPLDRGLLPGVEHVAGRQKEDDRPVRRQAGIRKDRRVLGVVHAKAVLSAERSERRDGVRNRVVPVLRRSVKARIR